MKWEWTVTDRVFIMKCDLFQLNLAMLPKLAQSCSIIVFIINNYHNEILQGGFHVPILQLKGVVAER